MFFSGRRRTDFVAFVLHVLRVTQICAQNRLPTRGEDGELTQGPKKGPENRGGNEIRLSACDRRDKRRLAKIALSMQAGAADQRPAREEVAVSAVWRGNGVS